MPKKKFSPTPSANGHGRLSRQFIVQHAEMLRPREHVDVPSFGEGMTVTVRGLTVADKNFWMQAQRQEYDPMSVVAGLCAIDDDGDLVFGETRREAVEMVESLPEAHRADVASIAAVALRLSGRLPSSADDNPEETAVEEAQKN